MYGKYVLNLLTLILEKEDTSKQIKQEIKIEDHDEDEFIGGVEIDANSKEEVWDQLKKLIKIEEVK